jgi:hypothetical protein
MSDVESQKRASRTHIITVWVAPILVGILVAIISPILLGYCQRPAPTRLEADVQENYFAYPPQFYAFGESFKSTLSRENLVKLLTNDKWLMDEPKIKEKADRIAGAFSELSLDFNYGFARLTNAMGIGGPTMLRITVFNSGETNLEGVRLEIPSILESQYERGGKAFITGNDQPIDIEEIRVGEKVRRYCLETLVRPKNFPYP